MSQIPADALSALLEDKEALTKVLLRHGVGGSVMFSKGIMWAETETAGGETIATQVFRRGVIKVSYLTIKNKLATDTCITRLSQ